MRWGSHLSEVSSTRKHKNKHIQAVYDKYGYDDWVFEVLFVETGDKKYHSKRENDLIHETSNTLNIRVTLTPEQAERKRIRQVNTLTARNRVKRENMTPEERKTYRDKINKRNKERRQEIKETFTKQEYRAYREKENKRASKWYHKNKVKKKDKQYKSKQEEIQDGINHKVEYLGYVGW